ncbi:MAG TPA: SRPBCC family protein [Burkholderiaceae bacterium]
MRWIVRIAGALVLLAVVAVLVGFALPGTYRVERSIVVAAPPGRLYPLVASPRRWKDWSMWNRRDPGMAITWSGPESGAGAGWSWNSRSEGQGRMTFTAADPATGVRYTLYFPAWDMSSTGELRLIPLADGNTRVSWTNVGDLGGNPLRHYLAAAMDHMVGPDFEAGLANLKAIAEHR